MLRCISPWLGTTTAVRTSTVRLHTRPVCVLVMIVAPRITKLFTRRSSSPDAGAVHLPLTCCCVDALPQFTRLVYLLYSALGRGLTLPHALPRCGAPTHLLPSLLLANGSLFVSTVPVWSGCLSCFPVCWSVICCQDSCAMVRQRRIPEKYPSHNFDEHCLEDTRLICCLSYPSGGAPLIPGRYISW
jgi:hypothetical protein